MDLLKVKFADAINLIPDFSGEGKEIEFVNFREGCKSALRVLCGSNKEDLLLPFLKNKLKGNAHKSFSLKLKSYLSISGFLKDLKQVYASECDDIEFWIKQMENTHQEKGESMLEYSAKFQELLQCAILGMKYTEEEQNYCIDEKKREEVIKKLEEKTKDNFLWNMYQGRTKTAIDLFQDHLESKNFIELVGATIKFREYELLSNKDFCVLHRKFGCKCNFYTKCSRYLKCCVVCFNEEHLTTDCPNMNRKKNGKRARDFDSKGFGSDGFDRRGFDSDGFDRRSFDSDGFNSKGFGDEEE